MTRKQKFAQRHNTMAAACLSIAKDCLNDGYPRTFDYFFGLAKAHQEMCHSYGF